MKLALTLLVRMLWIAEEKSIHFLTIDGDKE
jgi:hypothetical protein